MSAVINAVFPPNKRILVVSDIHGNLPYLQGALDKVGFCDDDILIIDGDFLEKGRQSLDTLHYVMELAEKGNTYVLRGNCDGWHAPFDTPGEDALRGLLHYMLHPKPGRSPGLIWEMCREAGLEVSEDMNLEELRRVITSRFAPELDFLRSLPKCWETFKRSFCYF